MISYQLLFVTALWVSALSQIANNNNNNNNNIKNRPKAASNKTAAPVFYSRDGICIKECQTRGGLLKKVSVFSDAQMCCKKDTEMIDQGYGTMSVSLCKSTIRLSCQRLHISGDPSEGHSSLTSAYKTAFFQGIIKTHRTGQQANNNNNNNNVNNIQQNLNTTVNTGDPLLDQYLTQQFRILDSILSANINLCKNVSGTVCGEDCCAGGCKIDQEETLERLYGSRDYDDWFDDDDRDDINKYFGSRRSGFDYEDYYDFDGYDYDNDGFDYDDDDDDNNFNFYRGINGYNSGYSPYFYPYRQRDDDSDDNYFENYYDRFDKKVSSNKEKPNDINFLSVEHPNAKVVRKTTNNSTGLPILKCRHRELFEIFP